jgi:hypothetical protein
MTIHYGRTVRNSGPSGTAPEGFTSKQWHQDASADTGTSYLVPGRLYIVQCEWCPDAFAAETKEEAMILFWQHEDEMNR